MYNVVRRFLKSCRTACTHSFVAKWGAIMAICAIACPMMSCNSDAKRQKAAADALVAEAETLLQDGRYEDAFVIMDSVDNAYPKQIEARRAITKMRSKAMGDYAELQIYQADSIIAELNDKVELEAKRFEHVPGGDLPGYYVIPLIKRDLFFYFLGLEGRIDDSNYRFYIVAQNTDDPGIGVHQIAIATRDETVYSEALPVRSERAGEIGKNAIDVAVFEQNEVESMLQWLEHHIDEAHHMLLVGTYEKQTGFVPEQAQALIDTWHFAQMASQLYQAKLQREKAERQLIIARDHSVNLE